MSSEIEVPETPNWLQELEAKRERRLKARLGHEAGAGAPCLKCGEKCPGLDLHFWRKCCKICKCSKEEHEVQDDDIYGWAQFQLLGSKPNKVIRKIQLPGKKDELELDWTPKGHNETVDKYLKTLPPEQLPVKGSQAAQDRKQLLHKQIPIHDIDPTLCHELSNEELQQMNDYISHVKETSVGVGQIVSLSNIIKANLHMLNPSEAALIASRYPKGIPLSEIVKLQSQTRANALKPHGLNETLDKLSLQEGSNKTLPNFKPNTVNAREDNVNPWVSNNVRDISYSGYTKDGGQVPLAAQFSTGLKPGQNRNYPGSIHQDQNVNPTLDERFMQNPNFDPKNTPSQFIQQTGHHGQPYPYRVDQQAPFDENVEGTLGKTDPASSAFAPYTKGAGFRPGERYIGDSPSKSPSYSSSLPRLGTKSPSGYRSGETSGQDASRYPGGSETSYIEDADPLHPNFAKHLAKYPSGHKKGDQVENFGTPSGTNAPNYENVEEMRRNNPQGLPSYIPGKYNVVSETLSPTKVYKSVKDLSFTIYNPNDPNSVGRENVNAPGEENAFAPPNLAYENYPPGYFDEQTSPYKQGANKPGERLFGIPTGRYPDYVDPLAKNAPNDQNLLGRQPQYPGDNVSAQGPNSPSDKTGPYNPNSLGRKPGQYPGDTFSQGPNLPFDPLNKMGPYDPNTLGRRPGQYPGDTSSQGPNLPFDPLNKTGPYDPNSLGRRPGQYPGDTSSQGPNLPYDPLNKTGPYDPNTLGRRPDNSSQGPNLPFDPLNKTGPYDPNSLAQYPSDNSSQGPNLPFNPLDKTGPYDPNSLGRRPGQYPSDISSQNPNVPFNPLDKTGPYDQNSLGRKPGQYQQSYPGDNVPTQGQVPFDANNSPYDQNTSGLRPGQTIDPNNLRPGQNVPYELYPGGNVPTQSLNVPYDRSSTSPRPGQYAGPNKSPLKGVSPVPGGKFDQDVPLGQYDRTNSPYPGGNVPGQQNYPYGSRPNKKLSELHPGKINIDEDYLLPSQVTIGAIQDINYPEIKAATQGTNDFYEDYSPESLREILNNVKLPDCHYCKKPFEENEFAITIDRANVLFHAQCFKCAGCNQILADNVYFYNKETDNVYCGRDYAKVRGFPRCKACDELIFTKEYCLAENSTFHLKHFCCIECDKPLAGQDYTLEDEMPYCLPCFEHSKASKCSACGMVIKPDEVGCNLNGVHFHAVDECFACKVCKKPLMGQKLLLRNEKLYCSHDCFGTDK